MMIPRLIVAAVAIPVILLVVLLGPVWLLGILAGFGAAVSVWELLHCALKTPQRTRYAAYAAVVTFLAAFLTSFYDFGRVLPLLLFVLFSVMGAELLLSFRGTQMKLESFAVTMMAGSVFSVLPGTLVLLRQQEDCGSVYALLPFVLAFASDSGAFFAGLLLGRHKLAPSVSPKKTLEGSVGGFLFAILLALVYGLILRGAGYTVNLAVMGAYGFLGSLASQFGDLVFSAIKRECEVKDYGSFFPGHGGMLDRADSLLACIGMVYILTLWVPAIIKI